MLVDRNASNRFAFTTYFPAFSPCLQDRAAMDVEGEEQQALQALQASASHKQADFEARKRAKITSEGGKAGDAGEGQRVYCVFVCLAGQPSCVAAALGHTGAAAA
jgi:hypothetical protein